jgi:deazaflavin-dependent oxidoreductase (nitroreductase family)
MTEQPANPPPAWLLRAFVGLHVAIYRLSGGAIGGRFGHGPVGLITAPGRKSGKPITTPLIYVATDRGYAVIASFAGAAKHPAWYLNLKAAGRAQLEIGRRRLAVRVEEPPIDGDRYRAIWRDAVAIYSEYDAYQAKTNRRIPVVELIADPG